MTNQNEKSSKWPILFLTIAVIALAVFAICCYTKRDDNSQADDNKGNDPKPPRVVASFGDDELVRNMRIHLSNKGIGELTNLEDGEIARKYLETVSISHENLKEDFSPQARFLKLLFDTADVNDSLFRDAGEFRKGFLDILADNLGVTGESSSVLLDEIEKKLDYKAWFSENERADKKRYIDMLLGENAFPADERRERGLTSFDEETGEVHYQPPQALAEERIKSFQRE